MIILSINVSQKIETAEEIMLASSRQHGSNIQSSSTLSASKSRP